MINTAEYIQRFISEVKEKYPSLHIDYEYNTETNEYNIWHDDKELESNDDDFLKFAGEKAEKLLFSNDIYNFYFGYDYCK